MNMRMMMRRAARAIGIQRPCGGVAMLTLHAEFEILRPAPPPDFDGIIIDAGAFVGAVAEVEAVTLAQLRHRFGGAEIGIVKLDIEGAEKALFEAEGPELRAARAIFVELHDCIAPGCSEAFHRSSRDRRVFPS